MLSIILHADDFGLNAAVTGGILQGFADGLLTSTSLLANAPDAPRAIEEWKDLATRHAAGVLPSAPVRDGIDDARQPWDFGIHLNLTQGRPLTGDKYPAALLDAAGRFPGIYRLFRLLRGRNKKYRAPVEAELAAQIALLSDHSIRPTHLNGHQYVELLPPIAELLPDLMARFAIPVLRVAVEPALARTTLWRNVRLGAWILAHVKQRYARKLRARVAGRAALSPRRFFGTAHAGRIDARTFEAFLTAAGNTGVIEIGMHPGLANRRISLRALDDGWNDPLATGRPHELALLQSPALAERLRARNARLGRLAQLGACAPSRRDATHTPKRTAA